jgi:hypothetical protein
MPERTEKYREKGKLNENDHATSGKSGPDEKEDVTQRKAEALNQEKLRKEKQSQDTEDESSSKL